MNKISDNKWNGELYEMLEIDGIFLDKINEIVEKINEIVEEINKIKEIIEEKKQ